MEHLNSKISCSNLHVFAKFTNDVFEPTPTEG